MKRTQPSFLQAMMLIMLSVGLISHVLIIPALLAAAKGILGFPSCYQPDHF